MDETEKYANEADIEIIGDIPFFVSLDSADVWANKELYQLDTKGHPLQVAGVPPDYFSATGQLWGNPLYDWKHHEADGYSWWIDRIKMQMKLTDYLRIDHFRGFEAYWSVPADEETAVNGKWKKARAKTVRGYPERARRGSSDLGRRSWCDHSGSGGTA